MNLKIQRTRQGAALLALVIATGLLSGCGVALPTSPVVNQAGVQAQPANQVAQSSAMREGGPDGSGAGQPPAAQGETPPISTQLGGTGQGQNGGPGPNGNNGKHRGRGHNKP